MSNLSKIAQKFLNEIKSNNSVDTLEILIESLETKTDPEPSEIFLLDSLYQLQEKFRIAESKLHSFILESKQSLPGNKLTTLYEKLNGYGTSKIFND